MIYCARDIDIADKSYIISALMANLSNIDDKSYTFGALGVSREAFTF